VLKALSIIQVTKSRRTKKTGHVTHIKEIRGAYRVLVGWCEGRTPLQRPRHKWEIILK